MPIKVYADPRGSYGYIIYLKKMTSTCPSVGGMSGPTTHQIQDKMDRVAVAPAPEGVEAEEAKESAAEEESRDKYVPIKSHPKDF